MNEKLREGKRSKKSNRRGQRNRLAVCLFSPLDILYSPPYTLFVNTIVNSFVDKKRISTAGEDITREGSYARHLCICSNWSTMCVAGSLSPIILLPHLSI